MAGKKPLMMPVGDFGEMVHESVLKYGGYVNEHAHLDRASTLNPNYLEHYGITPLQATSATLKIKQSLTGKLHEGRAYSEQEDLEKRIRKYLDRMIRLNVRRVISFIDATSDIGLSAIKIALALKDVYSSKIDFKIAAHPIFGFKEEFVSGKSRWGVFEEACGMVDVVGALPERDDRPGGIGFDKHLRKVINLGQKLRKPVHIHTDQSNDPRENHTLDVIEAVRWLGPIENNVPDRPAVWCVHVISPSSYPEDKFKKMVEGLVKFNIGVICCPRAALSMRQNRAIKVPMHNSIARVLEMAYAGVPIMFGTDNIADMYVPTGSGGMLEEVLHFADDARFYSPEILAKFASGTQLNQSDTEKIRKHLEEDVKVFKNTDPNFKFCLSLD